MEGAVHHRSARLYLHGIIPLLWEPVMEDGATDLGALRAAVAAPQFL